MEETKEKGEEPTAIQDIIDQTFKEGLDEGQVRREIDEMIRSGHLFEPRPNHIDKPE